MEKIQLMGVEKRRGTIMSMELYQNLTDCILKILDKNSGIGLNELIEEVYVRVGKTFRGELPWHILQVKVDLEERGIINTILDDDQKRIIQVTKKKVKK